MALHSQFRTYHLAVEFHRACTRVRCPGYLRNQLLRASSSVALNLSEGNGKPMGRDRTRFYTIAMGSLRESQTALELLGRPTPEASALADRLGAHLYRLLHPHP